jgi:hypothetical protein
MNQLLLRSTFSVLCAIALSITASCSNQRAGLSAGNAQIANAAADQRTGGPTTAAKNITGADIAKLKWLVGSYEGTGADKPFFNRYRFNGTTLYVDGFEDKAMTKQTQSAVYELKDGMFANPTGDVRFAASEITDDHVQFVTITGKPISYRLSRESDNSVRATLEGTGPDGSRDSRSYVMERMR